MRASRLAWLYLALAPRLTTLGDLQPDNSRTSLPTNLMAPAV
jgi:hypothetical protein